MTSAPVTLTVIADIVPPAVQRAASLGTTNVVIVFTKPVEAASATNSANYVFTNGLPVTAASLSTDTVTVTLTTAPLVYGSNYCLVINNVRDRASTPIPLPPTRWSALRPCPTPTSTSATRLSARPSR